MEKFCKICQQPNPENSHYYSVHKLPIAKYYSQYYNKKDLYDGTDIKFVSSEQYLLTDFNSRISLRKYLESLSISDAKTYCVELLKRRKELKNLKFTPSQTELKSVLCPPMQFLDKIFNDEGGYYKVAQNIGFVNKFVKFNGNDSSYPVVKEGDLSKNIIFIDSREQHPIITENCEIKKLNFGDYTLSDTEICGNVYIERKSLADFIGSLSKNNFDRFNREIQRAKDNNAYIIILVEEKISNFLSFKHLPWISKKIKASDSYIFHQLRLLLQTFDNLQVVFCENRTEMKRLIPKILFNGNYWKQFDIQYVYEKQLI